MSKEAHQSIVRELSDENSEKQVRIKSLEAKINSFRSQVRLVYFSQCFQSQATQ